MSPLIDATDGTEHDPYSAVTNAIKFAETTCTFSQECLSLRCPRCPLDTRNVDPVQVVRQLYLLACHQERGWPLCEEIMRPEFLTWVRGRLGSL